MKVAGQMDDTWGSQIECLWSKDYLQAQLLILPPPQDLELVRPLAQ